MVAERLLRPRRRLRRNRNSPGAADGQTVRWPVGREDLPDQVLLGDGAPLARVARRAAVVAHHEVLPGWDLLRVDRPRVATLRPDVRAVVEALAVDVDEAVPLLPRVAREADQALDERAAGAAAGQRERRRLEDDDVEALRASKAEAEA